MTLFVEDGSGLPNADSFISVDAADSYHLSRGRDEEAWSDLDEEVKEAALRRATDYMTQTYRGAWTGYRKSTTQALDWPRKWVPVKDAPAMFYSIGALQTYYADDAIPAEIQRACAELALRALSADLLADLGRTTTREKIGDIEIDYAPGALALTKRYVSIEYMLQPFLTGGRNSAAVART